MSYINNYTKWCGNDKIFLDNYIKTNNIVDNNSISYLSNNLKRTKDAIIYKILKNLQKK